MILRVTVANIGPELLAEHIQKARLTATVFASFGAGSWGAEPGATAEFAFQDHSSEQANIMRFIQDLLVERGEQAAYVARHGAHGSDAFLHWADRPESPERIA